MNGQEIANRLIQLVTGGQTGLVQLRAVLALLHDENVEEFYSTLYESEFAIQVGDAMAGNGLIPHLASGMESPLTLTDNQQEYKYPDRANAFLGAAYGAKANAPGAELIADAVTKQSAPQGTNIQAMLENAAFNSAVIDPEELGPSFAS